MEISVVLDPIKEVAKNTIIDTIKTWYTCIRDYNANIAQLQDKYQELSNVNDFICNKIERDSQNLQTITMLTKEWLSRVQTLMEDDQILGELIDEVSRNGKDQCCFGSLHCNLYQRYRMSSTALTKADEVKLILEHTPSESRVCEPLSRSEFKCIPSEFLTSLSSRVKLMEDILKKLDDDQVNGVGIFGMGAIGKTTLLKEIANKGAKDMFDEIVMAEISECPNAERIQDQIAEQLGTVLQEHNQDERAIKLYNRLLGGKLGGQRASDKKRRTILIILDNMWEKLDLGKLGFPKSYENTKEFCCKFLITSRKKDVCEVMGLSTCNIFEVHNLDLNEARQLFRARVGVTAMSQYPNAKWVLPRRHLEGSDANTDTISDEKEQEELEKKLLKKCGGLPLTIVALADVLKDKDLSIWEHFANELAKPTKRGIVSDVNQNTYAILETSYKLMESEEKKSFFLLACLFPIGSSIRVEDMMRYGMGLGLFEHVNNLIEAQELANTWVDELKSSALVLEDDRKGFIRIHDVVRACTLSMIQTGVHNLNMFMVDAFPRWLSEERCQKYSAISLMFPMDHSRLAGLDSHKLQILILNGSEPRDQFPDNFFEGMTNLKVLVLRGMNFAIGLPKSITKLKRSLRTLGLEDCKLEDIREIGELTNIIVLSLRKSHIKELVSESITKLSKLRLLDLRECKISTGGIPAKVLSTLSELEGIFVFDSVEKWSKIEDYNEFASIDELNNLKYLKVVEMQVPNLEQLPVEENSDTFVRNLDQFFVSIMATTMGKNPDEFLQVVWDVIQGIEMSECSRTLVLQRVDVNLTVEKYSCLKALLHKSQRVALDNVCGLDQFVANHTDNGRLEGVKQLCICDSHTNSSLQNIKFHNLELYWLIQLPNLKRIYNSQARLSKLRCLVLDRLPELEPYILPVHLLPPFLTHLIVEDCPKLSFIFAKENENENVKDGIYDFTYLKKLTFKNLNKLQAILGLLNPNFTCAANTIDNEEHSYNSPALFDTKFNYPALEMVNLEKLNEIVTLWDFNHEKKLSCITSFQNLKELHISGCQKLESLGMLSVVATTLVRLKTLFIISCPVIKQVLSNDQALDDNKPKVKKNAIQNDQQLASLFPSLETLILKDCTKLQRFLSGKVNEVIELRSLQMIDIEQCYEMQSFSSGIFRAPKLCRFEIDSHEYSNQEIRGDINQLFRIY